MKARILQIADIYDALTTNVLYRKASLPRKRCDSLQRSAEGVAGCSMVEQFAQICRETSTSAKGTTMQAALGLVATVRVSPGYPAH